MGTLYGDKDAHEVAVKKIIKIKNSLSRFNLLFVSIYKMIILCSKFYVANH